MKINTEILNKAINIKNSVEKHSSTKEPIAVNDTIENENSDVKLAIKKITDKGYNLSKEDIKNIKKFITEGEGTIKEKLEVIDIAFAKEIPLTEKMLNGIIDTENKSLLDYIQLNLTDIMDIERPKQDEFNSQYNKQQLVNEIDKKLKSIFDTIDKFDNKTEKLDQVNEKNERENIKAKSSVITKNEITAKDNDKVISQTQLKETSSKNETLSKTVSDDFEEPTEIKTNISKPNSSNDDEVNDILAFDNLKDVLLNQFAENNVPLGYIETKITPKLKELKVEFENFKKETIKEIEKIADQKLPLESRKEIISKVIDKVDAKIMKSNIGLYIDLKGEKKLLQISSNLDKIKSELSAGKIRDAEKMLKTELQKLEKIKFEPSIKKSFALTNFADKDINTLDKVKSVLDFSIENFTKAEKTPAMLVNYLRTLGINHEVECFEKYSQKQTNAKENFINTKNIKSILLNLQDKNANTAKTIGAVTTHLDKTQARNKVVNSKDAQTMVLDIPIKLSGRIKNVKVFIKSPQKNLKLDWKNFDLYFALHTDKLGKIGIKVTAVSKNINVKIVNDRIKNDNLKNFKDVFKNDIECYGYKLANLTVQKFETEQNEDKININHLQTNRQNQDKEGFNFLIW